MYSYAMTGPVVQISGSLKPLVRGLSDRTGYWRSRKFQNAIGSKKKKGYGI